jgi:hypothetical protein
MDGRLYDPISVFCGIALVFLHNQGTKLDMQNNVIKLQSPSWQTTLLRSLNTASREDMYKLMLPFRRFVELTCLGRDIVVYRTPQTKELPTHDSSASTAVSSSNNKNSTLPPSDLTLGAPASNPNSNSSQKKQNSKSANANSNNGSVIAEHVNHLHHHPAIFKIAKYFELGIRALQQTYVENNAEVVLQQIYNIISTAMDGRIKNLPDDEITKQVFKLLPPSCHEYSSHLINHTHIINLWEDKTLEQIAQLFEQYMAAPIPQNLQTTREKIEAILEQKNKAYLEMLAHGSR